MYTNSAIIKTIFTFVVLGFLPLVYGRAIHSTTSVGTPLKCLDESNLDQYRLRATLKDGVIQVHGGPTDFLHQLELTESRNSGPYVYKIFDVASNGPLNVKNGLLYEATLDSNETRGHIEVKVKMCVKLRYLPPCSNPESQSLCNYPEVRVPLKFTAFYYAIPKSRRNKIRHLVETNTC